MTPTSRKSGAMMGALTADAAGLGLHWLYDVGRIARVIGSSRAAFTPLNPENYKDAKGVFVHAARQDGDLSQYGETLSLAMQCIDNGDGFDTNAYQTAYAAHFGPGGAYVGYIDRPTRGTLANIETGQLSPSGVDDDQHPAISTLPAIVARYGADLAMIKTAVEVTNVNSSANHFASIIATTLASVMDGTPLLQALIENADRDAGLAAALTAKGGSVAYGEVTARACHLTQGTPLSWHILANTQSYGDAIETNIRAGGDSAGRAMIIGSIAGAAYGAEAIPSAWLSKLKHHDQLAGLAERLAT